MQNVSKRKTFFPRSYDSPHGKAPSERGTFLKLQFYQKVGNSRVEKYDCLGKSVI